MLVIVYSTFNFILHYFFYLLQIKESLKVLKKNISHVICKIFELFKNKVI